MHIISEITYTEPGIKGDTATNTMKPATIAMSEIAIRTLLVLLSIYVHSNPLMNRHIPLYANNTKWLQRQPYLILITQKRLIVNNLPR
jgi:hypothetical protein